MLLLCAVQSYAVMLLAAMVLFSSPVVSFLLNPMPYFIDPI